MEKEICIKSFYLALELLAKIGKYEQIIFLCLGSQRIVFDSLAVRVADNLKHLYNIDTYVYGGTDCNITRNNLNEYIDMISIHHPLSKIVVIDCALGESESVGLIKVFGCGTEAGAAFHDETQFVGDYSIIGIVGEKNTFIKNLLLTDRTFVHDMAKVIAGGISEYLKLRNHLRIMNI